VIGAGWLHDPLQIDLQLFKPSLYIDEFLMVCFVSVVISSRLYMDERYSNALQALSYQSVAGHDDDSAYEDLLHQHPSRGGCGSF